MKKVNGKKKKVREKSKRGKKERKEGPMGGLNPGPSGSD